MFLARFPGAGVSEERLDPKEVAAVGWVPAVFFSDISESVRLKQYHQWGVLSTPLAKGAMSLQYHSLVLPVRDIVMPSRLYHHHEDGHLQQEEQGEEHSEQGQEQEQRVVALHGDSSGGSCGCGVAGALDSGEWVGGRVEASDFVLWGLTLGRTAHLFELLGPLPAPLP